MSVESGNFPTRDRTEEFIGIVEGLKKSSSLQNGQSSSGSKQEEPPRLVMVMQSDFNRRASKIGFGMHQTSEKLAKLAQLAKRISVFDDHSMEIRKLTALIKLDIKALNSAVLELQFFCNSRTESGNISSDTTAHSTTVADDLKNRLMSTTKEFKEVLTMQKETLKVHENRRQLFSSPATKYPSDPFVRQHPLAAKSPASNSAASPLPWVNGAKSSSQSFAKRKYECFRSQVDRESQPLLQQQQNEQQQQFVPVQDSYMQSRAEALQNVESTIHELNNISNQLATLISQQGEITIRIDENMDDTLANVERAQGSLLNSISSSRRPLMRILFVVQYIFLTVIVNIEKYFANRIDENMDHTLANADGVQGALLNSISSNKWLIIKIFIVLIFFLMIFLFFLA